MILGFSVSGSTAAYTWDVGLNPTWAVPEIAKLYL